MATGSLTEPLRATLTAFENAGAPGEPMTTSEVTDCLEVSRRSTYDRLERLADRGYLRTKKAGARGRVWWRPVETEGTDEATGPSETAGGNDTAETNRGERHRECDRYERIVETVEDGVYALDDDEQFVLVNDAFLDMVGYDREELLGRPATVVHNDRVNELAAEMSDRVDAGDRETGRLEFGLVTKSGETVPVETRFRPCHDDGVGRCGVVRDVGDRRAREAELKRRVRQQEVVTELGRRALERRDPGALMARASELVARTLDADFTKVLDLDAEGETLLLRQGVGWDDGLVGSATVSAVEVESQVASTLASREPVVVEDFDAESRFCGPSLLTDHGVRSGISTIVGPHDDPWGIFAVHDTDRRSFSAQDVAFVQSVATILATAIERHDAQRRLFRQREQLAVLNNLNDIVHGTTDAVLDQPTREEIEATVCEHLAESGSYRFAWIGGVDGASGTVTLRTEAGVEGYLDGVTIPVDADGGRDEGPTGRALRTGETVVVHEDQTDPTPDAWEDRSEEYDFRSAAAIPIVHEETTYGVLNVYADRPHGFERRERSLLGQLGEVVGHAIAAVERKRALMSNEVVEVEMRIPDAFADVPTDGRIRFADVVPVAANEFLVYGRVTEDAVDAVIGLADVVPHWTDVVVRNDDGGTRFELRTVDPPVITAVASFDGAVRTATVRNGDYHVTVHLSPSTDVRQVVDAVRKTYPDAKLLTRTQVTRHDDAPDRVRTVLVEGLTERQRTALRAAYHAGFFEWPRDSSGEEVAESLSVSPPTFHQHLRKAEKKVFDSLLSDGVDRPE